MLGHALSLRCRRKAEQSLTFCFANVHPNFPLVLKYSESQEERAQRQSKLGEHFQEPTQQQVHSPDFESRPTTPPQQRMRVKDMSPSICRAPLKKKPYIIRKPMGPVRRRLFSQASPADVEEFLSELEQSNHQRFIDRLEFDSPLCIGKSYWHSPWKQITCRNKLIRSK